MMRSNFLALLFCSFFTAAIAQLSHQTGEVLYANDLRATFLPTGGMLDFEGLIPDYQFNGQNGSTIFSSALWMGAYDPAGNLKINQAAYGNGAYKAGPIDPINREPWRDSNHFERNWSVEGHELQNFIADFNDNGQIDDRIPISIKGWPARGNRYFSAIWGFVLPDFDLAPFFDQNNNGRYEPQQGDHPIIGEDLATVVPDELLWGVFNDNRVSEAYSGEQLDVEVQLTAWAFKCTDDPLLNQTIFTRYKITNYGIEDLLDLAVGLWVDRGSCFGFDPSGLRFSASGFGCDSTLNASYLYNFEAASKEHQLTNCYSNNTSYVQSISFLNQSMDNYSYFLNEGVGAVPVELGWPQLPIEYYNLLQGKLTNGTPLSIGGIGYDPANDSLTTSFAFFDKPTQEDGWSFYNSQLDYPDFKDFDFRTVTSTSIARLAPDEVVFIDMAYASHRDTSLSLLEQPNLLDQDIPRLQAFYDNDFSDDCMQLEVCQEDCVWAGDADHNGKVDYKDVLYVGLGMHQQATGSPRPSTPIQWRPTAVEDWDALLNEVNSKHADCDGNGSIDEKDVDVIRNNYGLVQTTDDQQAIPSPSRFLDLKFNNFRFSSNNNITSFDLVLEDSESLHGLSLDFQIKNAKTGWWFAQGFSGLDFYKRTSENFSLSLSRADLADTTWNFNFTDFAVILADNLSTPNIDGTLDVVISLREGFAVNSVGETFGIRAEPIHIHLTDIPYKPNIITGNPNIGTAGGADTETKSNNPNDIQLYPNPTTGQLQFFSNLDIRRIQLFDSYGKQQATMDYREQLQLSQDLPVGLYFVRFTLEDGTQLSKRVLLQD